MIYLRFNEDLVAAQIKELKVQRTLVAPEVEELVDSHLLGQALISLHGIGVKTAVTILLTVSIRTFLVRPDFGSTAFQILAHRESSTF